MKIQSNITRDNLRDTWPLHIASNFLKFVRKIYRNCFIIPEFKKHKQRQPSNYGHIWDRYVSQKFPEIKSSTPYSKKQLESWRVLNINNEEYEWPGDEWGDRDTAARLLDEALTSVLDDNARYMCELGAGGGRYTVLAFERFRNASILSFDVSVEFERGLRERCETSVKSGRLKTYLLDEDPLLFIRTVKRESLLGKIDAIYSFDAMVHVDLHTLLVYWLSATKILKTGGVLAMNVADPCNEKGFMKLLHDAPGVYTLRGNAGGQFMWISREIIESLLSRLGFEVTCLNGNGRDLFFSARLVEPGQSSGWIEKSGVTWFDI